MTARSARSGAILALLALPLPGQATVLQQRIDAAIADLGVETAATAAASALENLGAAAMPSLRKLLAAPDRTNAAGLVNALYVVGRLGATATAATPEVLAILRAENAALRDQAVWTLGQIGPFAPEALRNQCSATIGWSCFGDGVALERLRLGPEPELEELQKCLAFRFTESKVAAAQALAAARGRTAEERETMRAMAVATLATELERHDFPWDDWQVAAAPYLATFLVEAHGLQDSDRARALVAHFDPFQRLRGLVHLRGARPTGRYEQAEVLASLWDNVPEVRTAALAAARAWGGLVALAPLRAVARSHGDAAHRKACAAAADELVAARAAPPGSLEQSLLQTAAGPDARPAVDAPAAPAPVPAAALAAFVEILAGAEWCGDDTAERLLAVAEAHAILADDAIRAVLRLLANRRAETRAAAAAWLCRRGTHVRMAWEDIAAQIGTVAARYEERDQLALLVECHAFALGGSDASDDDLRRALATDSPRLAVRAACELAQRGAKAIEPALEPLRALERPWLCTTLPAGRGNATYLKPDMTAEAVAAASLARAVAGDGPWDHGELVAFVCRWRSMLATEAAAWLRERGQTEVGSLARAIEDAARSKLETQAARCGRPR